MKIIKQQSKACCPHATLVSVTTIVVFKQKIHQGYVSISFSIKQKKNKEPSAILCDLTMKMKLLFT